MPGIQLEREKLTSHDLGRITVEPGDLIMGDECGVVSVPMDSIDDVLKEAYKILENETHIADQLNEGKSFLDILKNNL